jgi:hypothetical protein
MGEVDRASCGGWAWSLFVLECAIIGGATIGRADIYQLLKLSWIKNLELRVVDFQILHSQF